jgi:hypothetical protein
MRRLAVNWLEKVEPVDASVDPHVERIYAFMDNLGMHKGTNALFFAVSHPRRKEALMPKHQRICLTRKLRQELIAQRDHGQSTYLRERCAVLFTIAEPAKAPQARYHLSLA